MKHLIAVLALAVAVAACGDSDDNTAAGTQSDGGTNTTIEPKLSVIAQRIFVQKQCTACHDATAPAQYGSLALTPDKAYDQLVNVDVESADWPSTITKRVVPGDIANSGLSAAVEQRTTIPQTLHMPVGTKLTTAEITAINTWIQNGAPND